MDISIIFLEKHVRVFINSRTCFRKNSQRQGYCRKFHYLWTFIGNFLIYYQYGTTIRKIAIPRRDEGNYDRRDDFGKQPRVMEVCIYAFRACALERPHSHRFGISVLYVHHGGLHVFLASEI